MNNKVYTLVYTLPRDLRGISVTAENKKNIPFTYRSMTKNMSLTLFQCILKKKTPKLKIHVHCIQNIFCYLLCRSIKLYLSDIAKFEKRSLLPGPVTPSPFLKMPPFWLYLGFLALYLWIKQTVTSFKIFSRSTSFIKLLANRLWVCSKFRVNAHAHRRLTL